MLQATQLIGFGARRRGGISTLVDRTTGTNIGNLATSGGIAECFDGVTSTASGNGATIPSNSGSGYVGKTFGVGKVIEKVIVYGSNNDGFTVGVPQRSDNNLYLYGKNGTPSSETDGTILAQLTNFTDVADESGGRTLTSTDQVTAYTSVWVRGTVGNGSWGCAELVIYELA